MKNAPHTCGRLITFGEGNLQVIFQNKTGARRSAAQPHQSHSLHKITLHAIILLELGSLETYGACDAERCEDLKICR